MPEFAWRLDYESPRKSVNVVTAGKGNAKAWNWKAQQQFSCLAGARFDRESDTKESDRVGNARTKGSAR
ncbi:hypothetical protein, partial [Streptomyces sp. NPDC025273]|uniref:hypothetical protein n=1 Tax=Streptomyces sp. NPDC025273 TaxID=3155251 RepID=UPI0033F66E5F